MFGCLGDARWASIYAVAAGATLLWTATWWGTGIPWDAGVDPATVPAGSVAGLSLVTRVVLGSWLLLGWRTVAVQSGAVVVDPGAVVVDSGAVEIEVGAVEIGPGAVDNRAHPPPEAGYAPPPGDPAPAGRGEARPAPPAEARSADDGEARRADDTSPSRPSVGVPK